MTTFLHEEYTFHVGCAGNNGDHCAAQLDINVTGASYISLFKLYSI
jgi:hypothetical protein